MQICTHSKSKQFYVAKLFSNLNTFSELEKRIALIQDKKEKGDAFEVFVEAYLATQRKYDVKKVWALEATPLSVLKHLSLKESDYGVDGLFQSPTEHYSVYQVKFRAHRKPLTWVELSTFIGLSDNPNINRRILITNCDDISDVLPDRQGFFCIRGSDLDRLAPSDFLVIEAWLSGSIVNLPKEPPKLHQLEALSALLPALQKSDRVSAIMACGTGKTRLTLWVSEQLNANKVIVFLPSLALLRQTLHEWLKETSLPSLTYLCVCSDATVDYGLDGVVTKQSELDFEVNTKPENVRLFLDLNFTGVKVVFTTYHSAHVIGEALKPNEAFDFGIFDEAHKTAGREGRNYGFALDDNNLKIYKRLFVTATPRHYNPHKRDTDGEAQLLFSMDNPSVYGEQAYRLTFAQAAERKIICNYKVVISIITSQMINDEVLSKGEVIIDGDNIKARQVANQIALRDAVAKYGVKKIFTFHKTVKSAQSFVADGNEGVKIHLPHFETYHVNGGMPTSSRERVMRDFKSAANAIITNARCLTEGVDVPAVDMVAFLSPRRSQVDIVQATGRAMRRSDDKTIGYVLVPLYVEQSQGESVDEAVKRAEFSEIWDILQSLQEQDEVLADIISSYGEQQHKSKGFSDKNYADKIEFLGPLLQLDELKEAVATRCLDGLYSSWDSWYGKLKDFKEMFGHCNVKTDYEEKSLARWVVTQRNRNSKNKLTDERVAKLNAIRFVWDFQSQKTDETWLKWYAELAAFTLENGNPHITRTHTNTKLASWVWTQRLRKDKSYANAQQLNEEQFTLLDKLGFYWDPHEERWQEKFNELLAFKAQYGDCQVEKLAETHKKLLQWVNVQRAQKSQEKLTEKRISLLESVGFGWQSVLNDDKWQNRYLELKSYYIQHGDADVPDQSKNYPKLAKWVGTMRVRKKQGKLDTERIKLLDEIQFSWKLRDRGAWEDNLDVILAFKKKYGHCNIPLNFLENPKLARFVNMTRVQRNKGLLSEERIEKLDAVGFVWSSSTRTVVGDDGLNLAWKARYQELIEYKNKFGDCVVKRANVNYEQLANWVEMQRRYNKLGKLHLERIRLLDEVGFLWVWVHPKHQKK